MERSDFSRKVRAAWTFLRDRMHMVRAVSSLAPLGVDEDFRRIALDATSSYREIYLSGLARSHYNVLLPDYAYFQFGWVSNSAWRLAYFPNPWISGEHLAEERVAEWEEMERAGLLANEDVDELISELPYLASVPPIRFEYSVEQYREVIHPAAHMHVGRHADNRWPWARLLDPLTFTMMVTKLYYPASWKANSRYSDETIVDCQDDALIAALAEPGRVHQFSDVERRTIHLDAS